MNAASLAALIWAAFAGLSCVDTVDATQRRCPCAGEDVCCAALDVCLSPSQRCPSGEGGSSSSSVVDCSSSPPSGTAVIDDMEDLDSHLSGYQAAGNWIVAHDDTPDAWQTPQLLNLPMAEIPGGRCDSRFALHTQGAGFRSWGALAGLVFHSIMLDGGAWSSVGIDASGYRGFQFWARSGEGASPSLVVAATDVNTVVAGGVCVDTSEPPDGDLDLRCWNYFAKTLTLTTDWVEYRVLFDDLHQDTRWGLRGQPLAVEQIFGLNFMVPPHGESFDVWIDDIRWITTE